MVINSRFWLPDITGWWHQQEESHQKYANLCNVACDTVSIIPHGVRVEASVSLGRDINGWRQCITTGMTLWERVVVRQFVQADNGILVGDCPSLNASQTENNLDFQKEVDERTLHKMAQVHGFLEMWHGSQNLVTIQKESHVHNKQMTAVKYISDTEVIIKTSWSNFQHDGAAVFELSERSPLQPALSEKDLPGRQTHVLNSCRLRRIDGHIGKSDDNGTSGSISNTKNWHTCNGDLDYPNGSEDDCKGDNESHMQLGNGINPSESQEHRVVIALPNLPELTRPIRRSIMQA